MRRAQPGGRGESVFDDDEPVVQSHPLLGQADPPRFGERTLWDFNGVVRRAANVKPARWRLPLREPFTDPVWNLTLREVAMVMLNPRHPAVTGAGLSLPPRPYTVGTVLGQVPPLRDLIMWRARMGLEGAAGTWRAEELRAFVSELSVEHPPRRIAPYLRVIRRLHVYGPVLAHGGPARDPWEGKTVARAAGTSRTRSSALSTPVIPPATWFALISAAWRYVHEFGPDILRAAEHYARLRERARPAAGLLDQRLEHLLSDPAHPIPVHGHHTRGGSAPGDIHWTLLALSMGIEPASFFARLPPRRERILAALATGQATTRGIITDLAHVTHPDATSGPWHPGLGPEALRDERAVLRDACFTLVVGLSMMRDSEIHEITKGSLIDYYASPAIVSTKGKLDPALPVKAWWITEPVAEAITTAEQLSRHPERVFAPIHRGPGIEGVTGRDMLDRFIAHVNATGEHTGLAPIPPARVRPHMFRRTMAMLTDQFPGSEIALGLQLKHIAARALANRATQGYAAPDTAWAEHLENAIDAARFRRVEDLYHAHQRGEPVGHGPAAQRITAAFDQIRDTSRARGGDSAVERALLRAAHLHIRFGTLNHCAFDPADPAGALCLQNTTGVSEPAPDQCRPDRCANSIIAPEHLPVYDARRRALHAQLRVGGLTAAREALIERELAQIQDLLDRIAEHAP